MPAVARRAGHAVVGVVGHHRRGAHRGDAEGRGVAPAEQRRRLGAPRHVAQHARHHSPPVEGRAVVVPRRHGLGAVGDVAEDGLSAASAGRGARSRGGRARRTALAGRGGRGGPSARCERSGSGSPSVASRPVMRPPCRRPSRPLPTIAEPGCRSGPRHGRVGRAGGGVIRRPADCLGGARSASSTALRAVPLLRSAEEYDGTDGRRSVLLRSRRRGTMRSMVEEADGARPLGCHPNPSSGTRIRARRGTTPGGRAARGPGGRRPPRARSGPAMATGPSVTVSAEADPSAAST